jgi:putative membrane protein
MEPVRNEGASAPRPQYITDHLANERTYLAYLRTTVALMTFGVAINRFSLFLEQSGKVPRSQPLGHALVGTEDLGIGMLVIGALLLIWAASRFAQVQREIEARAFRPGTRSIWIITVIVLVAAISGAGWLILG